MCLCALANQWHTRGEPLRDDHMHKLQTPPILQFIVVGKNSPKRTERQSYLCPFFILALPMHLRWNLRKNGSLFAILYEERNKTTNNRTETTHTGNPHRPHVAPSMSYGTLFPCYLKYKQINRTNNVQGMIIMEQAIKSFSLSLFLSECNAAQRLRLTDCRTYMVPIQPTQ